MPAARRGRGPAGPCPRSATTAAGTMNGRRRGGSEQKPSTTMEPRVEGRTDDGQGVRRRRSTDRSSARDDQPSSRRWRRAASPSRVSSVSRFLAHTAPSRRSLVLDPRATRKSKANIRPWASPTQHHPPRSGWNGMDGQEVPKNRGRRGDRRGSADSMAGRSAARMSMMSSRASKTINLVAERSPC